MKMIVVEKVMWTMWQVLDPGLIGGLLLPVLGALPDTLLIAVSGLKGTPEEAQEEVHDPSVYLDNHKYRNYNIWTIRNK
jgi:hypothetical protein